jgi:VWFA-related protein
MTRRGINHCEVSRSFYPDHIEVTMYCMWARILLCTAAALPAVFAQTAAPPDQSGVTIRATTTLVQISVVAHDSKGLVVNDLKKGDFQIFDNGRQQDVAVFSADRAAPAPRSTALTAFPEDVVDAPEARSGYAAILLDYFNGGNMTQRARQDLVKMVEKADAGKIALYTFDGFEVKLIADFGSDRETLLNKIAPLIAPPPPPINPNDAWTNAWSYQTRTLFELDNLADRLSFSPGRKALIWVSTAYSLEQVLNTAKSDVQTGRVPQLEGVIERLMQKLNNADVALYPVDPCGAEECSPFTGIMEDYARRTGGVAVHGRNDLDAAMLEAADDVRFTYSLAFYPPQEGARTDFHQLKVQVTRPGITLKYKQGYSLETPATTTAASLMPPVPGAEARALAIGSAAAAKELEIPPAGTAAANVPASMLLPYFYTAPNVALVDLALEVGTASLKFQPVNGKQHAELRLDALASRPDGGVAARFTDTVKFDFATEAEASAFQARPYRYEHQFRLAPGSYNVRVIFGGGEVAFGKVEMPLTIDAWDGQHLGLSGVALARESRKVAEVASGLDAGLLEGRKALIARSTEIIPSGSSRFPRGGSCFAFLEIYEPLLAGKTPPKLSLQIRVLDRQTGEQKVDSGVFAVDSLIRAGEPVVPVSLTVPIASLSPGSYRLEVRVTHSSGSDSVTRSADFEVE